jgi:protein STE50
VHLDHDALKELEVLSVGHRLYILKQIYNLKIAHGVKFEKDDYVPICTSSHSPTNSAAPKGDDEDEAPQTLSKQLKERGFHRNMKINADSKICLLESEIKRVNDQLFRLKEELVPIFKYAREKVHHSRPY